VDVSGSQPVHGRPAAGEIRFQHDCGIGSRARGSSAHGDRSINTRIGWLAEAWSSIAG
jgi:hypothetical protein